jgi:VWFA-related protein
MRVFSGRTMVRYLSVMSATLLGAAVAAQDQPTFRAQTDLVPVYVVVRDAAGQPIHGLTKDDFSLVDRKRPQRIDLLEEISRTAASAAPTFNLPLSVTLDVAANRGVDQDRVAVIVVDDLHLYRDRADRAKDIARRFIESLGARTPIAVVRTSGRGSTQVTQDHGALLEALESITGERAIRRPIEAWDEQMPREAPFSTDVNANAAAAANINGHSVKDFFDDLTYYKTLRDAAGLLGSAGGRRKIFILISEGIGKDLSWVPEGQSPCLVQGGGACYHDIAIQNMMQALQRANGVLYAVDPRGLVSLADLQRECFPSPPRFGDADPCSSGVTDWDSVLRQAQQGLEYTSSTTGGFAITNTDDLNGGVNRIVADLDNYYVLGFYPSDAAKIGYRQLSVTVSRAGATVRARPGYEVGGRPRPSRKSDALAALTDDPLPDPGLALRLFAVPLPGATRESRVALTLEVMEPRSAVEDPEGRLGDEVQYAVLVVSTTSGKAVKRVGNTAHIGSKRPMDAGSPTGVTYQMPMTLSLEPGRYQLRASAVSGRLKTGGSVYLDLAIPDFTRNQIAVSGLIIGYADGPHVPQTETPRNSSGGKAGAEAALSLLFPPSLDREFKTSDSLRVYAEVRNRTQGSIEAAISLIDQRDRAVFSTSQQIAGASDRPKSIIAIIPLNGLAPGAYRICLTTKAGAEPDRTVGVIIR